MQKAGPNSAVFQPTLLKSGVFCLCQHWMINCRIFCVIGGWRCRKCPHSSHFSMRSQKLGSLEEFVPYIVLTPMADFGHVCKEKKTILCCSNKDQKLFSVCLFICLRIISFFTAQSQCLTLRKFSAIIMI